MRKLVVVSPVGAVEVERAPCCGGVFFEPGEESALAAAVRASTQRQSATYEGLVAKGFAPPPDLRPSMVPQAPGATQGLAGLVQGLSAAAVTKLDAAPVASESERRCPRCRAPFDTSKADGVEIDVCPGCSALFLDGGEVEHRGVDLRGVFGDGPEAASAKGPSTLACPVHGEPMVRIHVAWVGGLIEVERADGCCGGMFFDDGEWDIFVRASRAALSHYADRVHRTSGEFAGEAAIAKKMAEGGAAVEEAVTRGALDRASQHMAFWSALKHLRRYGGYHGYGDY